MNMLTLIVVTIVNAMPDTSRWAIMPALKLTSLILGVSLYEDGSMVP